MNTAITHVVEYAPYLLRNECCAVGLLVGLPGGEWQGHAGANLKKARAIDPSCNIQALRDGISAAAAEVQRHPDALHLYSSGIGGLRVLPSAGQINYRTQAELDDGIHWALASAVEPLRTAPSRERASISRLFLEVKNAFSSFGWIATSSDRISSGRIVPRFALSTEEGLTLDFAQESERGFVAIQTLDYRHNASARRTEANAKLLTMGIAPQIVLPNVQKYGVFAGSNAPEAAAGLRLAERTCDDIFLEDDSEDMGRFMDVIAAAMGQDAMPTLHT